MQDNNIERLSKEESEYEIARHFIEQFKVIVLKAIKRARQRARWENTDDDEYFAEEIARDIFNEWRKLKGYL